MIGNSLREGKRINTHNLNDTCVAHQHMDSYNHLDVHVLATIPSSNYTSRFDLFTFALYFKHKKRRAARLCTCFGLECVVEFVQLHQVKSRNGNGMDE